MLEAIRKATLKEADPVPPGFKTILEWGTQWDLSRCQAERLCKTAVKKELMEAAYFRIPSSNALRKTLLYRDARKKTSK